MSYKIIGPIFNANTHMHKKNRGPRIAMYRTPPSLNFISFCHISINIRQTRTLVTTVFVRNFIASLLVNTNGARCDRTDFVNSVNFVVWIWFLPFNQLLMKLWYFRKIGRYFTQKKKKFIKRSKKHYLVISIAWTSWSPVDNILNCNIKKFISKC